MKEYHDIRDAVFGELYEIALNDPDVIVITADTGVAMFEDFAKHVPDQFYNVGIAEQNAISVAAGLTKVGKKPFVFGISNFVTLRCFEQIRTDVCAMKCPVVVLGIGAGYTYAQDGPTHHMTENLAVMNTLPGITIWNTSDYSMTANLVHLAYMANGPCYLSFDKGPFNPIYPVVYDFNEGIVTHGEGSVGIVASGIAVKWAFDVVSELKQHAVNSKVIDLFRLKPLNCDLLAGSMADCDLIVTIEEHNASGGIGSLVANVMAEKEIHKPIKKFNISDVFRYEVADRDMFRQLNGMDHNTIVDAIIKKVK